MPLGVLTRKLKSISLPSPKLLCRRERADPVFLRMRRLRILFSGLAQRVDGKALMNGPGFPEAFERVMWRNQPSWQNYLATLHRDILRGNRDAGWARSSLQ